MTFKERIFLAKTPKYIVNMDKNAIIVLTFSWA